MNRLINYMISNNLIPAEDKDLYAYGLKQGAFMLLNIVTTLLIGAVMGMIWQSVVFTGAYIPLRSFAGGYHARTQTGCYFISSLLVCFSMVLIKTLQEFILLSLMLSIFASIVVFLMAPLADDNKPLTSDEFRAYKTKARKLLAIEMIALLIMFLLNWEYGVACIAVSLGLQSIMLVLHKLFHIKTRAKSIDNEF